MPGRTGQRLTGKPWGLDVTIEFSNERMALRFEKYLKSGAGHAFASNHFVDEQLRDSQVKK